jgi:hypothetical protein
MVLRLGSSIEALCEYDYERCEDVMVAYKLMD